MIPGIYKITNIVTGRCYIGKSIDVVARLKTHRMVMSGPIYRGGSNTQLYNDAVRFGIGSFKFEVLKTYDDSNVNEMSDDEFRFIFLHKALLPEFGYNRSVRASDSKLAYMARKHRTAVRNTERKEQSKVGQFMYHQYDVEGNQIATFANMTLLLRTYPKFKRQGLCQAADQYRSDGSPRTYGGFIWRREAYK